jgi:hypothetical protein
MNERWEEFNIIHFNIIQSAPFAFSRLYTPTVQKKLSKITKYL